MSRKPSSPIDLLTELAHTYPRIAYTRVANDHIYLLNHPDLARELLTTHGRVTVKSQGLRVLQHLFGQGLLTSEGELHKRQRRLIQPAFHQERIARYSQEMAAATAAHERRWEAKGAGPASLNTGRASDGGRAGLAVDMYAEMSALTLAVVGRTLFGADLRENTGRVAHSLDETMRQYRRFLLPFGDRMLELPLPWSRRTRAAARQLNTVIRDIIDARRAAVAVGGAADTGDLLSTLMLAQEDGVGMSHEQLRDEVMTLMLAGHETTASTLSWAWYLLATHPEIADTLHREADTQLGGRPATFSDLAGLPYAHSVIAETMRLYPPAWSMGRELTSDIELDSWVLPAGSVCVVSPWTLHRDPRFWPDPLVFRPGRWLRPANVDSSGGCPVSGSGHGGVNRARTGRTAAREVFDPAAPGMPRGAWLPFGMGRRVCVGESFSWTEAVLVLTSLIQRWRCELEPSARIEMRPDITLHPAHGLPMRLHPRATTRG
jgi:cytochrome P450